MDSQQSPEEGTESSVCPSPRTRTEPPRCRHPARWHVCHGQGTCHCHPESLLTRVTLGVSVPCVWTDVSVHHYRTTQIVSPLEKSGLHLLLPPLPPALIDTKWDSEEGEGLVSGRLGRSPGQSRMSGSGPTCPRVLGTMTMALKVSGEGTRCLAEVGVPTGKSLR